MALNFLDRILTVAVTATLTSAAWVVIFSGAEREREVSEDPSSASVSPVPDPARAPVQAPTNEAMLVPVAGIGANELADTFRDSRGSGLRMHEAIDIPAPAGTAVVAAASGTVEKLFLSEEGGNTVYIRSPDRRTMHYYAHLQDYAEGLTEGRRIERGQRLGSVGSSGNANAAAPHLHFAVLRMEPVSEWSDPGTAINPYPMLRAAPPMRQADDRNR